MRLSEKIRRLLRCPTCRSELVVTERECRCLGAPCGLVFPIVDGVPVLINEAQSVFSVADFTDRKNTFFRSRGALEEIAVRLVPEMDLNLKAAANFAKLAELLAIRAEHPRVLVVGGSAVGRGADRFLSSPSIELVESDVTFGPRTVLIADGHDIPFADESFDGAIIQAVLEHVVDPYRCVEEIHRVLKRDGLVYAETPFMQQVHGGKYDFTRFSHLGHRRLFRRFEEVSSGAVNGPGMALAWAYQYFLLSFVKSHTARNVIKAVARLTAFWLTYFDYYLIDRAAALDAAAGYYFMGRKSESVLSDRSLIQLYRGGGVLLPVRRVAGAPDANPAALSRWRVTAGDGGQRGGR